MDKLFLLREARLDFNKDLLRGWETENIGSNDDGQAVIKRMPVNAWLCTHGDDRPGISARHADEVLAAALFFIFFPSTSWKYIFSRREDRFKEADFVFDTGEGLLDHHGKQSSPGVAACTKVFLLMRNTFRDSVPEGAWERFADIVCRTAALDTGEEAENPFPWLFPIVQEYQATYEGEETYVTGPVTDNILFEKLVGRVVEELLAILCQEKLKEKTAKYAEEQIAAQASSPVVVFSRETRFADVKALLWSLPNIAVYYVSPESDSDWRVLCAAPKSEEFSRFGAVKLIPEEFRSLRNDALTSKTGIPGGIFSHAAGFIAGFKTKDSAVKFAELCVEK